MTTSSPIKLQLLLHKASRTPDGISAVLGLLPALGIHPTVAGNASISAEMSLQEFEKVFGFSPQVIEPRGAITGDYGQSPGHTQATLSIPTKLRSFVENISLAPPHLYLDRD
ncbi:MAG: hypothetical protein WCB27_05770 [Thermoguttaceae bacterium]